MNIKIIAGTLAIAFFCGEAAAEPLVVPFDFSRTAIGLDLTVKGAPLYMILDTGVDPSVIDLARADALGLKVDRAAGGEATGEGDAKEAKVFPATIEGLSLGGRSFAPIEALAIDMSTLSASYGRPLDGVLGFSFLTDKIVLIDYPKRSLHILDHAADAATVTQTCAKNWTVALRSFEGDNIPIIPNFRFGEASGPISLDTGSNGGISLYQSALNLKGVRRALTAKGETAVTGARGKATAKLYVLNASVGFGPFALPAGEAVSLHSEQGSTTTRVANVGNKLFAAMNLKMLLDYRAKQMTFYGDCH